MIADTSGKTLAEGSVAIGQGTNNIAEFNALLEALKVAQTHKLVNVRFETDSDQVFGHVVKTPKANGPDAYMKFGPCADDVCSTVQDVKTTSISGAFCVPQRRSCGIARALLDNGLAWAREQGYERCSVDWESSNIEATAFWLRHFKPVCLSLRRVLPCR